MYQFSVPIEIMSYKKSSPESIVRTLHKMKVKRVMLCGFSYFFDSVAKDECLSTLAEAARFYKSQGFEVGAWKWTFMDLRSDSDFTRMRLPSARAFETMDSNCGAYS